MSRCSIYDLDVPDEKAELALKDADQKGIIETVYANWFNVINSQYGKDKHFFSHSMAFDDLLYEEACKMIRPFKEKITGVLDDTLFELKPDAKKGYTGHVVDWVTSFYVSALLNETNAEKLLARKCRGAGYRLRQGKTLEIGKSQKNPSKFGDAKYKFGEKAEGGTIINYGEVTVLGDDANLKLKNYGKASDVGSSALDGEWANYGSIGGTMGRGAFAGTWLNKGMVRTFGTFAEGGIWLNHNKVTQSMGAMASRGLWFNFGDVMHMGNSLQGGMFVAKKMPSKSFANRTENAYGIGPEELEADNELSLLVDSVEEAGNAEKFDDIRKLARQVDEHVRKNYQPRKIA